MEIGEIQKRTIHNVSTRILTLHEPSECDIIKIGSIMRITGDDSVGTRKLFDIKTSPQQFERYMTQTSENDTYLSFIEDSYIKTHDDHDILDLNDMYQESRMLFSQKMPRNQLIACLKKKGYRIDGRKIHGIKTKD